MPEEGLPVAVIGAGPVGLAAAAQLLERGLRPVIFEAGDAPGAAIRSWSHIRLFSPWQYNIDAAARRLLEPTGWQPPRPTALPYGRELVQDYLAPLAALPVISEALHTKTRVLAVARQGMDKTRSLGRNERPYLVRTQATDGSVTDHLVRAVVDASGTWSSPNPLGEAGLAAPGETEARGAGFITEPLPDVTGRDRDLFAGRHVLVVGAGHSAANTLLSLGELARAEPGTRISWAVRGSTVTRLYGGGDLDGLPARGMLGTRLRRLVEAGVIDLHTSFSIIGFSTETDRRAGGRQRLLVQGRTPGGTGVLDVDLLVPATGFRPDLDILKEVRLELDPGVEAPRALGPLIDPDFHSCGTVPPHGATLLAHPDKDFYIAGMKSYGRAPTFLLATGYEQVRSIAAALAGDRQAADQVQLELPETGVCSTDAGSSCDTPAAATESVSCCGSTGSRNASSRQPVSIGFATGSLHGRSGD